MSPESSFADLMARLRAGDRDASALVFERFTRRLIGLARAHLDARLRQKVDPEDVLQSAYKSFFIRHARGEFDIDGWDGLWALLTVITVRKCSRVRERF
jgi:RNA polymerase sigma-70 factor (ECF subfamily)